MLSSREGWDGSLCRAALGQDVQVVSWQLCICQSCTNNGSLCGLLNHACLSEISPSTMVHHHVYLPQPALGRFAISNVYQKLNVLMEADHEGPVHSWCMHVHNPALVVQRCIDMVHAPTSCVGCRHCLLPAPEVLMGCNSSNRLVAIHASFRAISNSPRREGMSWGRLARRQMYRGYSAPGMMQPSAECTAAFV